MTASTLTRRRFLAGLSVGSVVSLVPAAEQARFPVLSFNIRYANPGDGPNRWENRRDTVAASIAAHASIAGLQEVLSNQLAELQTRLPGWGCLSRTREARDGRGEACPILWKKEEIEKLDGGTFWLSETPEEPGSISWESSLPRICTWGRFRHRASGCQFHFHNVHLDHKSARAREMGAVLIAQRLAKVDGPAIVLGDFNSPPDSPPLRTFTKEAGWQRLDATAADGAGPGTFNGWQENRDAPAIDHILLRGFNAISPVVLRQRTPSGGWASDHFAVKAEITKV